MGSAYADEVDPADPTRDDRIHLTDVKQDGPQTLKRSGPDTRAVVPDNSAYVKIHAKGDGTDNASAMGENSIAIGSSAKTRPATSGLGGAVAIGTSATAAGNNVALGGSASATGELGAVALGASANASGKSSVALGYEAQATNWGAYALGRKAQALADSSVAIGETSMATRAGTVAIGHSAAAAAENAVAIGESAAARATDSLALGSYSEADRNQTVSVGIAGFERQIVNVGRGTQATDAVNIAQLKDVTATLGGNAAIDANGNIKKPAYTIGSKTYDNVGDALLAASEAGGGSENAVEYDSTAKNSVTLGGTGSAAVKLTNVRAATLSANSTDAVNGAQLFATNNRVTNVEQSLTDSGLIDPSTGESLAVVYKDATKSAVALGGTGGTVVTNVKAGKVASASKDAVNGGQLYDVSSSVASALGGETTVNTDGTLSKPTYKVGDKTFNNVGDALQAAAAAGGAGGEDANAVHYDGAGKSSVTLGGTGATKPVSLKNVATGTAATDAVNVAQLQSGMSDVKDEIKKDLGDGTLDMKYIKVRATGMQASALGKNSVAIGSQASATNVDTLAIGSGARASGVGSIAIGVNSVATGANTVSIGDVGATRRIVNVSDGVDETDAVTVKQLTDAMHFANTKLDTKMMRMTRDVESKPGSFVAIEGLGADGSMPNIASMNGNDPSMGTAAAIGVGSGAGGINAIAVGLQAVASSDHAVAIGSIAQTGVDQPYSVAMGSMVTTNGAGALAIGSRAKANADNAVALGNNGVTAVGKSSIAIGDKAMTAAGSVNSVAMGKSATVAQNVTDAIALGTNANVASGNSGGIALGANSVADRGNALSVGSNSLQRQIINVAKGTKNNDAVNVSQLTGVTNALGGGAGIDTDGTVKAPTYKVGDTTYNNVGDALDAMSKNGGSDPNAVAYDSATKDVVTLAGTTSTKLTNVKAAELSATSTDAVNGSQLFATNENLGNLKDALTDGGVLDKTTGESLAVVYDSTSKDKVTLAGKTGTTLSNVAAGKADLDAVNVSQLKSSGLIGEDGKSVAAVTYDKKADGTPNYNSVTLGGGKSTGPVTLSNVAQGKANTDAVNVEQLTKAISEVEGGMNPLAVSYDTVAKDKVTLAGGKTGTTLTNVAAGKADTDAVNVSQLKSSGLVGEDGKSLAAITYDKNADGTPNYKSATLAGEGGTKLTNVKAAELSATSTDAVNGSQLFATNENLGNLKDALTDGGVIDKTTGESLAVVYDSTSKDKVTLAGKTGTTLSNVAAGKADLDAVNVSQLKSSGLIGEDGKSVAAVTYDKKVDGTPNYNSVTLGGGKSTGPVTLSNVAQGKAGTDAVNVDQLTKAISDVEGGMNPLAVSYDTVAKDKVTLAGEKGTTLTNLNAGKVSADSKDAVNGSQLYGTAKSVADALGGGSTVDENGKVKAPTYTLVDPADSSKKVDYHTVGDALDNLDGRVASNTGDITNIKNQFTNTGLVDSDGDTRAAVTYDKNADGTPNYKSATLGGKGGTKLTNVKAAELSATSTDAVNGSQLFTTNENLGNLKDALTDGGVIDKTTGESLAVVYDSTSKDKVTLAGKTGTTLSNVAAGKADLDAVNVSQLKSSGLIGEDGKSIAAVTYDKKADGTPNYNSVTLGGGKSTSPVTLSNVAKGKAGTDAVNVDQLTDALRDVEGGMNPLAVAYDSAKKDKVTLTGEGGTTLSNVAAGKADTDAVNVSQLKSSGLVGEDGKSLAAITYDKNADGTQNYKSATLAGEGGTKLSNVKAGTADMDAVNVSQLKSSGLIGEDGKTLAAITYDKNADGTPNYKSATLAGEGGTTLSNVKAGKADMDAVNVAQLKSSGLVGEDGKSRAAVTYDKNADGTPNYKSATLAGEGGTKLSNVKAGTADMDAVNVSQLKSSGLIGEDGKTMAAVTYDKNADGTPNYKSATLAGEGGTKLSNVKAGTADMDAVNVSQLKSSGLIGEDGKTLAAITYDKKADGTPNYKSATLAGEGGTKLSNVAAGTADADAVNVSQLKSSGLIGEDGKSLAAVTYDKNADGTPNFKSATLAGEGGTKLSNVAAGKADADAVNVSQLKSSGLIGEDGKSIAAVTYDKNVDGTANRESVTLAGKTGTKLTNVKAAELSATSTDAVNGSQLFATNENLGNLKDALTDGGVIDKTTGESLAVVYDSTSKDKVTLAGKTGTTLSNVAAGKADLDAVNVSQLKSSGLIGEDGKSIAAVTYDKKADGTPNYNSVTLGGGKSTGPVTLSNVAQGKAGTDAVNVDQLNELENSLTNGAIKLKYIKVNSEGREAVARGPESVAIGANAWATRPQTMALGSGSRANGLNSVAIGYNSVADDDNTVSVGNVGEERRIVHVAAGDVGVDSTDAVNGAQLYAALDKINANVADQEQRMMMYKQTRDVESKPGSFVAIEGLGADGSMPNIASMNGRDPKMGTAAAIGVGSGASGINAIAVGLQAVANSDNSVAIGSIAQTGVDHPYSVAMGSMVTTNGAGALAIGSRAKANAENAVALGNNGVTAVGKSSIAIGDKATTMAGSVNSIAIGTNANVYKNVGDAVALGVNSQALSSNSVALGANSLADRANALSIGKAGAERQIIHVANGTQNTDAVNLGQLKGLANVVGGGTGFDANGDVTAPTYTIDGKEYHNVNDALQAAAKSGGNGENGGSGTDPNAVAYDGAQKDKVTLAGQNGTTLSNVAAGKADTDAVNVSQLKSSGLIDKDGNAVAAMTYDKNADGTPNFKSATLAGEGGTKLANVAAGTADTDAVNVSQLKSSGLIGENGKALAAVTYDTRADGTTNFASVTFGGANAGVPVALHNVAAGTASTDAVNVSQLKGVTDIIGGGAGLDADGNVTAPVYNVDGKDYASVGDAIKALEQREGGTGNGTNPNAVVYDNATKEAVTLAGTKGTVIRNVADGSLALDSTEAVNGGQLNFVASSIADSLGGGAKFDPVTGDISAPTYELTAADGLTNTYDNVGDAFKHVDERVSTHTTQIETLQKGVANAVQYDDATHASVSLGGAGAAPVRLKNVADGVDETDGVNVRQLRSAGLVGEDGKLQSAVVYDKNADGTTNYGSVTLGGASAATPVALHNVAAGKVATDAVNVSQLSGVTDALGGGAKIDEETGKVVAPTYNVGGDSFHNAGDALNNIDNRVTQIQNNLGEATKLVGAVAYDKNGDGTVNFNRVTLGNGLSSGPVVLTNVADGKSQYDAVNFGQYSELKGRVDNIDERLNTATTPGDGNSGTNGNDLIHGTGGSGKDSAEILAAKPGTGNGNIAVGSGSQIADGKHNSTAAGAGSKVQAEDGTALGHGATVSSGATNSVALGSGSKATEANTVSFGSDGHERRLVNVADGVNKTDAVNKGQLDRAIGGMQGQINDMSRNAYSGIAAATALTMIPGVDPGKTLSFGVGGASYKGYQAVAMGGEARITENLKMRAGVGLSSGGNTFGVGASYQW